MGGAPPPPMPTERHPSTAAEPRYTPPLPQHGRPSTCILSTPSPCTRSSSATKAPAGSHAGWRAHRWKALPSTCSRQWPTPPAETPSSDPNSDPSSQSRTGSTRPTADASTGSTPSSSRRRTPCARPSRGPLLANSPLQRDWALPSGLECGGLEWAASP